MQTKEIKQSVFLKAHNVEYFRALLGKLNKRAAKLGLPEITTREIFRHEIQKPGADRGVTQTVVVLCVIGESPILEGWSLAGVVEHTRAGNILKDAGAGVDLSQFREIGPTCDHCNLKRNRAETVVLLHDSGKVSRVGKSCLKDYLRHHSIDSLAWWADLGNLIDLAADLDEFSGGSGYVPRAFDLAEFLSWCAADARIRGFYLSRGKARETEGEATADAAMGWLSLYHFNRSKFERLKSKGKCDAPTAADMEAARDAIAWTAQDIEQAREDRGINDYQHNLAIVIELGETTRKLAGYAASILGYHRRGIERQQEREARQAAAEARKAERIAKGASLGHVGTVGEKWTGEVVIGTTKSIEGFYGVTYVVSMETIAGDRLVWFASNDLDLEPGARCFVRGTIKEHGDFQDMPQTVITRCVVRCPVCTVEGAFTKTGKPRKNGAPFKNLHRCDHWSEVPANQGGGLVSACG